MKRIIAALGKAAPDLLLDTVGLVGAGLVGYGAWLAYPPSGFMAGGALLILGCWFVARGGTKTGEPE